MAARRMLSQSLNAEFSQQGVHTVHVNIDGMVDSPDTLGRLLGLEKFEKLRQSMGLERDGLLLPEKIAEAYWHLASQHRSCWTHELICVHTRINRGGMVNACQIIQLYCSLDSVRWYPVFLITLSFKCRMRPLLIQIEFNIIKKSIVLYSI